MKIFHLSDLHIGIKLLNRDLSEDQIYILDQICDIAKERKPDVIVIAGDIYDKSNPSAEAVEIFNKFVNNLNNAVPNAYIMMISGNHDNINRIDNFRDILANHKIYMIGRPPMHENEHIEKVTVGDEYGDVNFYLLPFVKPSMVKEIVGVDDKGNNLSYDESVKRLIKREDINYDERNVLVSHQFYLPSSKDAKEIERMDNEVVTVGNIDQVKADILYDFDYAALGHIHKPMKVGSNYHRYCGTPLACSTSEANQQKAIIEVTLKTKGDIEVNTLPLTPLRNVRVIKGLYQDVLKESSNDYVKIILTDKEDLDVIDMQDRLRFNYPCLLEISREAYKDNNYELNYEHAKELSTFELCKEFLTDLNEEELELLKDVINDIEGGQ